MDPADFDAEVMRQTNRTARRAFPRVFDLEQPEFLQLRDRIVNTYRDLKASRGLRKLGLRLRFLGLLAQQFCQPMVASGSSADPARQREAVA